MIDDQSDSEPPSRDGYAAGARPAPPNPAATVEVAAETGLLTPAESTFLIQHTHAAAARLGLSGEVRIRVVGDLAMAAGHERYSKVSGTTDVLTFDLRDETERAESPARMDVDIWVCADEARRQAARRGHSPEKELLLYTLHGLLHCLGHGDHDDDAFSRMHAREDEVLRAIGVGPVFSAAPTMEARA
jgi:probable rRNA maturation factor